MGPHERNPTPAKAGTFGEALRLSREFKGDSRAWLARFIGVKAPELDLFELDLMVPSADTWRRIFAVYPWMRKWKHDPTVTSRPAHVRGKPLPVPTPPGLAPVPAEAVPEPRERPTLLESVQGALPVGPAAPVEAPLTHRMVIPPPELALVLKPPASFAEALRLAVAAERLPEPEVAALVEVTPQALRRWMAGSDQPLRECYERLCTLFPVLREAPKPPRPMVSRKLPIRALASVAPTRSPSPMKAEPEVVESVDVIASAVKIASFLHGGAFTVEFAPPPGAAVPGGRHWTCALRGHVQHAGSGVGDTPAAALRALMGELRGEIDRRRQALDELTAGAL